MNNKKGYKSIPLSINRQILAVSASVTKKKNTIHAITEIDISEPRSKLKIHFDKTGERLSFTAYIISCLAQTIKDYPELNSFIKGKKQIFLEDINISVLIEREIDDEKIPEPFCIRHAQSKSIRDISSEIKNAKEMKSGKLGSFSGMSWIRFIPSFLLKMFISIADKNIKMAEHYGKIAVTSVGMKGVNDVWFIPHGSGTLLLTIGGMKNKVVKINGQIETKEFLSLTASFDHDIIDGAPAMRFLKQFSDVLTNGKLLNF